MAVERWLHMSRRTLITVRRVYIIETVLLTVPIPHMALRRLPGMEEHFNILPITTIIEGVMGFSCLAVSSLAYFKVFRIIRSQQRQIRANTVINLEKYKKSVYTILWILALFLVTYLPYVLSSVAVRIFSVSYKTSLTILHLATTVMLTSS